MKDRLGDKTRLLHIVDAIDEINSYIENVDIIEFEENSMIHQACIRQLEIIGEACSRLSDELRTEHQNVEWSKIIAFRNLLIHEYFGVDTEIIWEVINNDLPVFFQHITELLKIIENE